MVKVAFYKDDFGYQIMDLQGHAQYNPGNDIVCSAISALVYTLVGSLQEMKVDFAKLSMTNGVYVEIEPLCDDIEQQKVDIVFNTILTGLRLIEKKYPKNLSIQSMEE